MSRGVYLDPLKTPANTGFPGTVDALLRFIAQFMAVKGLDAAGSDPTIDSTEVTLFEEASSSFIIKGASGFTPLKILDSSTTLTIRIRTSSGTGTIKNVELDVLYMEVFKED